VTDQHHWRYRHERNLGRDDTQEQSLVHQRLSARRTRCISTGTLKGFATWSNAPSSSASHHLGLPCACGEHDDPRAAEHVVSGQAAQHREPIEAG